MRSLTFSLGLVVFLAFHSFAYGQFSSREYLLAIGDLVNEKVLSEQYAINPLQKLYYAHLLQPDNRWGELAIMIRLRAETEYKDAWLIADDWGSDLVENMWWSDAESIKTLKEVGIRPRNEPAQKETLADRITVVKPESTSVVKPLEKKTLAPGIKNLKTSVNVTAAEKSVEDMRTDFQRTKSADYIEYANVGFYHNTAIIHPSHQAEMASLAAHLKEDLTLALLIRGHCNGKAPRTIITAGIITKFFEVDDHHQQKTATPKELTELRAAYTKRYLISQGIHPERIQTIGEGAEKPIYPRTSVHAHYNDRVEFEIIKD